MSNTDKPTVCQVLLSLATGGGEMVAARLARGLRDHYRFVFVCLDSIGELGEQLWREGFTVHVVGRRPGVDWRCPWRLASLFRKERADIVHAHEYGPFVYATAARRLYRPPSLLFTEHGCRHQDCRKHKRVMFNRLLLERRDRVIGVGEAVRQALIQKQGFPAHRVEVIYNGIDRDHFAPSDERNSIRESLGIRADEFVVMQVARLSPVKDHSTAIATIERLRARNVRVRLALVGDGPEASSIQKSIERLRLQDWVLQLGLRNDIPRLLQAADVALLTSLSEGIPLSLIEAMAVGMPIVATSAGGTPEVVDHNRTGLLAPVGDSEALADALQRLREDAELRERMSTLGRERVQALFSQSQMHESYRRLYEDLTRRSDHFEVAPVLFAD